MREIKFRGKRTDNGEWVYGSLLIGTLFNKGKYYICPKTNVVSCNDDENGNTILGSLNFGCWYEVDPTTVGQYTGLHDKNGKEIYEGDILKVFRGEDTDVGQIEYDTRTASFIANYGMNTCNTFVDIFIAKDKDKSICYEVIGNIHGNPELSQKQ